MAGNGPPPKEVRRRSNIPARGDWSVAGEIGWQYGAIPKPPARMLKASRETWTRWMAAWYAAHWTPDDLPALEVVIVLWDQVRRGRYQSAGELRMQMDTWGITPKGQQDRRWAPPILLAGDGPDPDPEDSTVPDQPAPDRYGHLRAV